jgi:cysteinyl-tRNA synthetase
LLFDNLKTPQALAVVFETITQANEKNYQGKPAKEFLEKVDRILGVKPFEKREIPDEVRKLIEEREQLRQKKDFTKADEIRAMIIELGFDVEDTAGKTVIF